MKASLFKNRLRIFGVILLAILFCICFIVLLGSVSSHLKSIGYQMLGNFVAATSVVITLIGVVIFNRKFNGLKANRYGFHFKKLGSHFILAFSLAVLILTLVLLSAQTLFGIQIVWSGLKKDFEINLLWSVLGTFVLAAWEEVFFRGLVFTTLYKNRFGFHKSALISSTLFSMLHWSSFDMQVTSWFWYLGIVFMGYLLVILYAYTHSIMAPIFFHFFWNFLVDLMLPEDNGIGIFTIPSYQQNAKIIDNLEVFFLGVVLIVLWKAKLKLPRMVY